MPKITKPIGRETLTVDEMAARVGLGRSQAYEAVRRGHVPAFRIGTRWYVPKAALDRMLGKDADT